MKEFCFGEIRRRVIEELEANRDVIDWLYEKYNHESWISIKLTLNRGYLKSSFQFGGERQFNRGGERKSDESATNRPTR
jgi:hypothetical protein